MRVLMISKACVTAIYRTKLLYLNREPGVTVGLVVPPRWGTLPFEPMAGDADFPLFITPVWLSGRNHFHRYRGLAAVIRRFGPDLIHVDEEHYSAVTEQATKLAARHRIPSLFFTWQNLFKRYPEPFRTMEKRVFARVRGAIAGNHEAREVLRQKGFDKPVAVIPQFGADPRFSPNAKPTLPVPAGWEKGFVIGYVGRLIPEKGIDTLLAAASSLIRERSDVYVVIVGTGPWEKAGKAQAQSLGIGDRVLWVPWARSEEMPGFLAGLSVLVLPSRTGTSWKEQFGRVLTEAMATGIPVVGSDSGEIPHVIGEAGLVFAEGDAGQLAAAILRLIEDRALARRLSEAGIERVAGEFSQAVVARKTLGVYTQLLSPPS